MNFAGCALAVGKHTKIVVRTKRTVVAKKTREGKFGEKKYAKLE